MMRHLALLLSAGLIGAPAAPQPAANAPTAQATATVPTQQGGANRAIVLDGEKTPVIVGTAELAGLELYDLSGKRTGAVPSGEAVGLDVRYQALGLNGRASTIVAAADAASDTIRFFTPTAAGLAEIGARAVPLGFSVEGLCLYHSPEDGSLYAFAVGDAGEIDQLLLFESSPGKVDARKVRRFNVPSTAEQCVVDDRSGQLYVAEEAVGIWRFTAEPETDIAPALIDAVRLGRITEEAGGVALFDGGPGARWPVASDSSGGRLLVYDHSKDDSYVGAVAINHGSATLDAPGGLFATSQQLTDLAGGALLIADDDAKGGANYKIVPFANVAKALNIAAGSPQPLATAVVPTFPTVRPTVETQPMANSGDAADDPAIWRNPANPAASLVIGTDKQGGLHIYDMQGKSVQFVPDGKMNNVDLREGFRVGGEATVLVTASDRTNKAVAIYKLDTSARRLVNIADGIQPSGLSDPYGQCMYRSRKTGKYYVFISDPEGVVRQWELIPTRSGKVRVKPVRDIKFGSQAEGCVADDRTGTLYVAEEDVALWTVTAEPVRGARPTAIDRVETNTKLKDDLEGIGIYDLGDGRGYIVVSSQGNNSYAVYRRDGDHAYLGSFAVIAEPAKGIDGISETDGLDVSSANLGPGFEHGAMVAQDGRNVLPSENQNFKIVPWQAIANALKLEVRQ
jgi:3-phytase